MHSAHRHTPVCWGVTAGCTSMYQLGYHQKLRASAHLNRKRPLVRLTYDHSPPYRTSGPRGFCGENAQVWDAYHGNQCHQRVSARRDVRQGVSQPMAERTDTRQGRYSDDTRSIDGVEYGHECYQHAFLAGRTDNNGERGGGRHRKPMIGVPSSSILRQTLETRWLPTAGRWGQEAQPARHTVKRRG